MRKTNLDFTAPARARRTQAYITRWFKRTMLFVFALVTGLVLLSQPDVAAQVRPEIDRIAAALADHTAQRATASMPH
jgi:hypothetical protein